MTRSGDRRGLTGKRQKHGAKWRRKGARGVRENRFCNQLGIRGIGVAQHPKICNTFLVT